jgi:hypothetical protein
MIIRVTEPAVWLGEFRRAGLVIGHIIFPLMGAGSDLILGRG